MPWLELSLTIRAEHQAQLEAALQDLGALAVTLADAQDQPIFEPAPGETPLWPNIMLSALFAANADRAGLVHVLADLSPDISPEQIVFREVHDQEWTRAWMDQFQPMRFGARLWIFPSHVEPPDDRPDDVIIRLDPGLAFGTGTHPTTALCLEWLESADLAGKTLIDYGCGSGVLAIAALKLGATHAIGVDNDAQALQASYNNAQRNGVAQRLELFSPQRPVIVPADVLVANILAGPLHELAPRFALCVGAGGALAISGILRAQQAELVALYGEWFEELRTHEREDWVLIAGRRK
jgi:ribosomal protein L11 methyltransferase